MPTQSHPRRPIARHALILAATIFALLFAFVGQAFAVEQFGLLGEISGPAPGEHFGELNSESVAVSDFNKHVLVADSTAHVVYDFESASATTASVWSGSEVPMGSIGAGSFGGGHVAVAIDNETGEVYVADTVDLVIDKFDAEGKYLCQITGLGSASSSPTECDKTLAGPPTGSFSHSDAHSPLGIAVDQATHQLYVIDSGHQAVDVFAAGGAYESQITASPKELSEGLYAGPEFTDGIAVNAATGSVFIAESGSEKVFEFDSLGAQVGEAKSFPGSFVSVAVNNASGEFFISSTATPATLAFKADAFELAGPSIGEIEGVPSGIGGGVALDQASGEIYVADSSSGSVKIFAPGILVPRVVTTQASEVHPTTARLNGTINPESVQITGCHFVYGTSTAYGQSIPCAETPAEIGSGTEPVPVHADVTGLRPGSTYHYRLIAENANGSGAGGDQTLATPPTPSISGETATNLTTTTIDLHAQINPNGQKTTYHFEYGTTTAYGTVLPEGDAGSGSTPEAVTQHITDLTPNTTYHWRVQATNEAGTTTSPDHTFNYLTTGAGTLPDNRAYEMITPPNKNAALIGDVVLGLFPNIARNGERIILSALQCFANAESCVVKRELTGTSYQFQRTPTGWQATSLAPSTNLSETNSVWSNGADTGTALYSMPTPPTGQDDLYLRQPDGHFTDIGPTTPPQQGPQGAIGAQSADTKAATADFSHYVYGLPTPVWPFDATNSAQPHTLYEYVGTGKAHPLLVGVTGGYEEGENHNLVSVCGTDLGTGRTQTSYPGALSEDGTTVFFTAIGKANGECVGSGANASTHVLANTLYARVNESETILISGRSTVNCDSACQASPPGDAEFQGASTDSKHVFFTSTQQLTSNASEDTTDTAFSTECAVASGVNGCNLYEYDFSRPANDRVVAVSAGDTSGGGPQVQGVMAVSDDGSHVYFVAKGVLSTVANAQGQTAQAGANNLYVYAAGRVTFIAALASPDKRNWSEGPMFANVSPDGRFLVFGSAGRLTGDTGVAGVLQVFRYDAVSGELLRLSRGVGGINDDGNSPLSTVCNELERCPDGASVVRTGAFFSFAGSWRRDPSMSDDGSFVFFQSPVGLVPGALNDVKISEENGLPVFAENVYEWHEGRVSLISDGRDTTIAPTALCGLHSAVCLAGASVSGRDVFFTSTDKLVPTDTDTQTDFYDARVCSPETGDPCVAGPVGSVAACGGEACHGIPAGTPPPPSAPSASFNGAENPALSRKPVAAKSKCRKHFVPRHGRCVKVKYKARGHARGRHARVGRASR